MLFRSKNKWLTLTLTYIMGSVVMMDDRNKSYIANSNRQSNGVQEMSNNNIGLSLKTAKEKQFFRSVNSLSISDTSPACAPLSMATNY